MKKGFTLIELLVVIAIIGILSSVVLASLNTARAKGANAAIKSNLANIRAQAELLYDGPGNNYNAVCGANSATQNATIAGMISSANTSSGSTAVCGKVGGAVDATAWAVQSPLKAAENGNAYWCVDSTGKSVADNTALAATGTSCP